MCCKTTCLSTNMVTQRVIEPLVDHGFLKTSGSKYVWTRQASTSLPGPTICEQLLSWFHKRPTRYTWDQTVLARHACSTRDEPDKSGSTFFDPARLLKRAGSKHEPLFSCLSLVEVSLQRLLPTCLCQVGIGCNAKFAWGSPLPD